MRSPGYTRRFVVMAIAVVEWVVAEPGSGRGLRSVCFALQPLAPWVADLDNRWVPAI